MKKKTKINRTVATLAANPRNPNKMADEDKARMAKSLAEFGDLSGIVFNRRTKQLVGGHQRSDVMQTGKIIITEALAKPDRDGTVARGYVEHLGVQYQYREVDWPEARANAAMLAANRFGRVGEDDPGILKDVLLELDTGEFDTAALTGYDEKSMENLMTQFYVDTTKEDIMKEQEQKQNDAINPDDIITSFSGHIERLATQHPERLRDAQAIVVPAGRGHTRDCLVLYDPACADAATELRRLADAGEHSPVAAMLSALLPLGGE